MGRQLSEAGIAGGRAVSRTKAGAELTGKGTRVDYIRCDGKPLEGVKQGLL